LFLWIQELTDLIKRKLVSFFSSLHNIIETYHMIDRCEQSIACWSDDGTNFIVKNVEQFATVSTFCKENPLWWQRQIITLTIFWCGHHLLLSFQYRMFCHFTLNTLISRALPDSSIVSAVYYILLPPPPLSFFFPHKIIAHI